MSVLMTHAPVLVIVFFAILKLSLYLFQATAPGQDLTSVLVCKAVVYTEE